MCAVAKRKAEEHALREEQRLGYTSPPTQGLGQGFANSQDEAEHVGELGTAALTTGWRVWHW